MASRHIWTLASDRPLHICRGGDPGAGATGCTPYLPLDRCILKEIKDHLLALRVSVEGSAGFSTTSSGFHPTENQMMPSKRRGLMGFDKHDRRLWYVYLCLFGRYTSSVPLLPPHTYFTVPAILEPSLRRGLTELSLLIEGPSRV